MELTVADRIISNLKQEYSRPSVDGTQRFAESMAHLIQRIQRSGWTAQRFLDDIVQMIYRNYRIREVSVGRQFPQDGSYRYVSFCGFRKDAEMSLRGLSYKEEDFTNESVGKQISDWTWVFLSENKPFEEGEESTYNRPIMLERGERRSPEHCLEADYFDTRMCDRRNQFIGWIEYSGTMDYRFPDIHMIKEIELIAGITSLVLESQNQRHQKQL
jgi:hypothetical protein